MDWLCTKSVYSFKEYPLPRLNCVLLTPLFLSRPVPAYRSGVGFVNFAEHDTAVRARDALNGVRTRDGHKLFIRVQENRSLRAGVGVGMGVGRCA